MADGETGGSPGAGEANEMFGRNIGDEERSADEEPADVAAGEEVVLGGALFLGEVEADAEDDQEIDTDNDEIDGGKVAVCSGNLRCKEHSGLLGSRDEPRPVMLMRSASE